jgi:hypothetical protein
MIAAKRGDSNEQKTTPENRLAAISAELKAVQE